MFSPSQGFSYVFSPRSGSNFTDLTWTPGLVVAWVVVLACIFSQSSVVIFCFLQSAVSNWLKFVAWIRGTLAHSPTLPSKSGSYCLASSETDWWIFVEHVRHSRPTLTSASYSCYQRNRLFHYKFISIGNYDQSYHLPCRKGPTPGTLRFFPEIAQILGFSENLAVENNSEGNTEQNIEDLYFVQQLHVYLQLSI